MPSDERELREIEQTLLEIRDELAHYAIHFLIGNQTMSQTTFTTVPGGTFHVTPTETENGSPFTFVPANMQYASANTALMTVPATNADGSVDPTAVAVGVVNLSCTDTARGGTGVLAVTISETVSGVFDITLTAVANPLSTEAASALAARTKAK